MSLIKSSCLASAAVVLLSAMAILGVGAAKTFAQAPSGPGAHGQIEAHSEAGPAARVSGNGQTALFIAIAVTVGVACLSAGYAVGKVGAAALGAASEKPEILGRALIFVGLAEGIAIYGLIIGIMLLRLV
ncbi:MAG: V-type ATP synthase subunit K [Lentisphaerae bacterium ADurb.BinA184]|nr:MAG: V-type ATP synthase subunit K [Lentisphaerae bacterium ADurb.BinA184]